MRIVSLVLLITAAVATVANPVDTKPPIIYNLDDAPQLFEKFIKEYERHYKDEADKQLHYDAFVNTLKYVNEENAKGHSYTLGITLFADLTEAEKQEKFSHGGCLCPLPKDESQ